MTGFARQRARESKGLVGFGVAGVHYAVDIHRVREIIRPLPVIELPHLPPAVLGVADHRGEVLPVLDVRQRFGLAASERERGRRWVIVVLESRSVALVVDSVTEVFTRDERRERPVPRIGVGDAARGIASVESHRGELVFVVDVDRIAAVAEVLDLGAFDVESAR